MTWIEADGRLRREFVFSDFPSAFAFMVRVAFIAQALDHHPEWSNVYNSVVIELTTHSAGNQVTERDRTMAAEIDALVDQTPGGWEVLR